MRANTLSTTITAALTALAFVLITAMPAQAQNRSTDDNTYDEKTIIDEASGFLGQSAETVAKALENVFKSQGRPNGYITGSEAGGGLIVGLRYGGGTLHHKIEGNQPIHWTGPSVGFDAGADAVKTFALVYDLYDTEDVYKRIGAVEGSFYYVGGLGISYYGDKDVNITMIRVGVGLRAQATVGYLKFSKKKKLNPF